MSPPHISLPEPTSSAPRPPVTRRDARHNPLSLFVWDRTEEQFNHALDPLPDFSPASWPPDTEQLNMIPGQDLLIFIDGNGDEIARKIVPELPKVPREQVLVRDAIAKRRILRMYLDLLPDPNPGRIGLGRAHPMEKVIRHMAAIWYDHPDYKAKNWRPIR